MQAGADPVEDGQGPQKRRRFSPSPLAPPSPVPLLLLSSSIDYSLCDFPSLASQFSSCRDDPIFLYFFYRAIPSMAQRVRAPEEIPLAGPPTDENALRKPFQSLTFACRDLFDRIGRSFSPSDIFASPLRISRLAALHFVLAACSSFEEDFPTAIVHYSAAITLQPRFAEAYLARGLLMFHFCLCFDSLIQGPAEMTFYSQWSPARLLLAIFQDALDYIRSLNESIFLYENNAYDGPEREFHLLNPEVLQGKIQSARDYLVEIADKFPAFVLRVSQFVSIDTKRRLELSKEFDHGGLEGHYFLSIIEREIAQKNKEKAMALIRERPEFSHFFKECESFQSEFHHSLFPIPFFLHTMSEIEHHFQQFPTMKNPYEASAFFSEKANFLPFPFSFDSLKKANLESEQWNSFNWSQANQIFPTNDPASEGPPTPERENSHDSQAFQASSRDSEQNNEFLDNVDSLDFPSFPVDSGESSASSLISVLRDFYEETLRKSRARLRNLTNQRNELIKENKLSKNLLLCIVCQKHRRQVLFDPCGHFLCCSYCGQAMKKCPAQGCAQPVSHQRLVKFQ